MRVKSINCTGFSKRKKLLTGFSKKKLFTYNTSELKFTRTVHWFFEEKIVHVNNASELKFTRTIHFSEQCNCGGMLHCSLNSAAWCSRKKHLLPAFFFHAFQTQHFMGPMNSNLCFFFVTKRCCICILSKTHTQLLRQTLS